MWNRMGALSQGIKESCSVPGTNDLRLMGNKGSQVHLLIIGMILGGPDSCSYTGQLEIFLYSRNCIRYQQSGKEVNFP